MTIIQHLGPTVHSNICLAVSDVNVLFITQYQSRTHRSTGTIHGSLYKKKKKKNLWGGKGEQGGDRQRREGAELGEEGKLRKGCSLVSQFKK